MESVIQESSEGDDLKFCVLTVRRRLDDGAACLLLERSQVNDVSAFHKFTPEAIQSFAKGVVSLGTPWIKRDDAAGDRANSTQIFSDGNLPAAMRGRDANVVELCFTSSVKKTGIASKRPVTYPLRSQRFVELGSPPRQL